MLYQTKFETELENVLAELKNLLLEKNKNYGDAALNPVRIFSKASPIEQIKIRIDDKISRLARGHNAGEDVYQDLMGYLVLLRIAYHRDKEESTQTRTTLL